MLVKKMDPAFVEFMSTWPPMQADDHNNSIGKINIRSKIFLFQAVIRKRFCQCHSLICREELIIPILTANHKLVNKTTFSKDGRII